MKKVGDPPGNSGTNATFDSLTSQLRKKLMVLAAVGVVACGDSPGSIIEYILSVNKDSPKDTMLIAPRKQDDKPLEFCIKNKCYAYVEGDIIKIKKYIANLEERLKACEK